MRPKVTEQTPGESSYNRLAGQNLDRLAAISDGIFAVAMTLLVLDLRVPLSTPRLAITDDASLLLALKGVLPSLLTYFMSFLTLGIFWVGQQTQLNQFARTDRNLTWIHLAFLLAVALTPFSTALLAAYMTYHVSLAVYWLNIFLLGVVLFASWRYALHAGLVQPDFTTPEIRAAVERRIVVAQALYAAGALLCVVSTYLSIAVIVLLQLNYAIAPRVRLLYRI